MIQSSDSKKRIFYLIVLILTFVVMLIGATIAYFSLVSSQKEDGTKLYTGYLMINYIDGTYIKNPTLYPINKPNFNTYDDVYRNSFSVASNGTLEQTISIDLDVTFSEFKYGSIKYIIFNDKGKELATGPVTTSGKVNLVNNIYLGPKDTITFTLILWLDNQWGDQTSEMGHRIAGNIDVTSKQLRK